MILKRRGFVVNTMKPLRKYSKDKALWLEFVHKTTGQLIGYFSLANDRISVTDFEDKTAFNRFRRRRFVNEKRRR